MEYDNPFFGERLAKLRIAKGISAREMSFAIGQSANYINKIEGRKSYPSMSLFFYICDYLGITPEAFFCESTPPLPNDKEIETDDMRKELKDMIGGLDDEVLAHMIGIVQAILQRKH